jgi:hypothetical protein
MPQDTMNEAHRIDRISPKENSHRKARSLPSLVDSRKGKASACLRPDSSSLYSLFYWEWSCSANINRDIEDSSYKVTKTSGVVALINFARQVMGIVGIVGKLPMHD